VGRPKGGSVSGTADSLHEVSTPMWGPWPWPERGRSPRKTTRESGGNPQLSGSQRASAEAPPRGGVTLDSVLRLGQDTRAETAAGTRRRQGRWEPTHGEPQDHPSQIAGSGSSDAHGKQEEEHVKKSVPNS
jgi:hypothetical protein